MRIPALLLAATAIPLVLTGCGGPVTSVAANTYPDVPNGYAETINLFSAKPVAVWVHGRTELAVITVGSLTCAPVPTELAAQDAHTIAITYVKSPNSPCSADLSPTTNEFKLPDGFDTSGQVTVALHFAYDSPIDYSLEVHD